MNEETESTNEEKTTPESPDIESPPGCKNCGSPEIVEGFTLPLCPECRDKLVRHAMPIWIKIVSVFILLILTYSLFSFPSALNQGISYEKGQRFEKEKMYNSALVQYEKAVKSYPDSLLLNARLFISQYKTGRIDEASNTLDNKLVGQNVKDEALYAEVASLIEKLNKYYYPTPELNAVLSYYDPANLSVFIAKLEKFLTVYPDDPYAKYLLGNFYFDEKKFAEGEQLAKQLTVKYPDYIEANGLLAAYYREAKEYDKVIECCNIALNENKENPYIYSAMARIEIKRKNDEPALRYALEAYKYDKNSSYVLANLALAYHYNNNIKERDAIFSDFMKLKNIEVADYELVTKSFNGTSDWREK